MKLFYPGSFDPFTLGHLDIVKRGAALCDALIIGIGSHHSKTALLQVDQRVKLIKAVLSDLDPKLQKKLSVQVFDGLAVDAAQKAGASALLRGLRDGTDLDYEVQMSGTNHQLSGQLDTVFLVSSGEVRHIAAKLVRQIASMGGDISPFVPKAAAEFLKTS